jgi:hypothetical protein
MAENIYLSDEFVVFSQKIAELHARKKAKKEEVKTLYAKFEEEIKKMDVEAAQLQAAWEKFVASHAKK